MEIRRLNRLPNNIHLLRNVDLQICGIYDWSLPCNQVSSFLIKFEVLGETLKAVELRKSRRRELRKLVFHKQL